MTTHWARRWAVVALVAVPLLATACGSTPVEEGADEPAATEHVKGGGIRVRLTADASERLGVETVRVRSDAAEPGHTVIPYAAVLYDPDGGTWTYTSPKPFVFQRENITVDRVDGDSAILTRGPPVGTPVVTVGATEIWGVEYGGIEED